MRQESIYRQQHDLNNYEKRGTNGGTAIALTLWRWLHTPRINIIIIAKKKKKTTLGYLYWPLYQPHLLGLYTLRDRIRHI